MLSPLTLTCSNQNTLSHLSDSFAPCYWYVVEWEICWNPITKTLCHEYLITYYMAKQIACWRSKQSSFVFNLNTFNLGMIRKTQKKQIANKNLTQNDTMTFTNYKMGEKFSQIKVTQKFKTWVDLILFIVFNATFSNISAISWSTWREPPTMGKQLVNFITCGCESSAPFLAHLTQRVMW